MCVVVETDLRGQHKVSTSSADINRSVFLLLCLSYDSLNSQFASKSKQNMEPDSETGDVRSKSTAVEYLSTAVFYTLRSLVVESATHTTFIFNKEILELF